MVTDQSVNTQEDYNVRVSMGTLDQVLLGGSRGPGDKGRILNALDFPLQAVDLTPDLLSTDLLAWTATERLAFCNPEAGSLPARDIRWGLVATFGALHHGHIDSDGFATFIDVLTGKKHWFVARPKDDKDFLHYGYIDLYSPKHWTPETPNLAKWRVEAILLSPGMRLQVLFFYMELLHRLMAKEDECGHKHLIGSSQLSLLSAKEGTSTVSVRSWTQLLACIAPGQ